jgi:hypothetical protein
MALYEMLESALCYDEEKANFTAELRSRAEQRRLDQESSTSAFANELHDSEDESTESTQLLLGEAIAMNVRRTSDENTRNISDSPFLTTECTVYADTEF